jgi:hypothetical protein
MDDTERHSIKERGCCGLSVHPSVEPPKTRVHRSRKATDGDAYSDNESQESRRRGEMVEQQDGDDKSDAARCDVPLDAGQTNAITD